MLSGDFRRFKWASHTASQSKLRICLDTPLWVSSQLSWSEDGAGSGRDL